MQKKKKAEQNERHIEAICDSISENLVNDTMISWNKGKIGKLFHFSRPMPTPVPTVNLFSLCMPVCVCMCDVLNHQRGYTDDDKFLEKYSLQRIWNLLYFFTGNFNIFNSFKIFSFAKQVFRIRMYQQTTQSYN